MGEDVNDMFRLGRKMGGARQQRIRRRVRCGRVIQEDTLAKERGQTQPAEAHGGAIQELPPGEKVIRQLRGVLLLVLVVGIHKSNNTVNDGGAEFKVSRELHAACQTMMKIKNLKGECQHCGGAIEFRAETTGMTTDCPHCGQPTELLLAIPPEADSPAQTKAVIYTIIAVVILVGGLIGTVMVLKRAERLSARQKASQAQASAAVSVPPANPFAQLGFSVSPVTLETSQSGVIVHAVGKVHNLTNRQRFGVGVELELLDRTGRKVGDAKDYQSILEPNAEWQFRALVVEKQTTAARVLSLIEAR